MLPCDGLRKAGPSIGHLLITFAHGESCRTFTLHPGLLVSGLVLAAVLCLYCLAATLYLLFHDDMLHALLRRQNDMQFAYEDQLAAMRVEIDRALSRQLLDQDSVEGQVHRLVSRQAQLENRAALIAQMADSAGAHISGFSVVAKAKPDKPLNSVDHAGSAGLPDDPLSTAPILRRQPFSIDKPQPEALDTTPGAGAALEASD
jgi:hypothetical protein